MSTGATIFNHRSAKFYHDLGATRVVIPRHNNLQEIAAMAKSIDFMEKECFIFNSGCKNIDGFCTYHHGVNEILHKDSYKLPKKLGLDYAFLKMLRSLPQSMSCKVARACNFKTDSACLLSWNVKPEVIKGWNEEQAKKSKDWLESTFSLYSGLDPCGACALPAMKEAGIVSLKIVGRENPTYKKIRDVKFLNSMIKILNALNLSADEYKKEARKQYREIYGADCREWCYFPEQTK
jgi:putative protease